MDPSRHARLSELFLAACELPAERRASFLRGECGEDEELMRQLEGMLAADSSEAAAVDTPALGAGWVEVVLDEAGGTVPETVGEYRVLGLLGEGGMGAVYRARQANPEREVALKVIRPGHATASSLRRFEVEARLLGRLRHPGIAQVYEAGIARAGDRPQPYFAMELVLGEPVDAWAARSPRPEVLRLLIRLAEAIHHAHQKGVVHRDLKPANVLVEEGARPRVLDFGVARATDDRAEAAGLTLEGQLIGTPAYMAPEQVGGDPDAVDARSDVYALGVLAYELLAGRLPLEVARDPLPVAVRRILEEDPPPLGALDRTLRGDVETIVAKALAKEPERRYPSAAAFGRDLERHLQDEPIEARPASAVYQLGKLARRHRGAVVGAALGLVLLLAGLAAAVTQAVRATAASEESEAVVELLTDVLTTVDNDRLGRDVLVADALAFASERLSREEDALAPAVEARLHEAVGQAWYSLGKTLRAREHLLRSIELREALGRDGVEECFQARFSYGQVLLALMELEPALGHVSALADESRAAWGSGDARTQRADVLHGLILGLAGRSEEGEALLLSLIHI